MARQKRDFSNTKKPKSFPIASRISGSQYGNFGLFTHIYDTYKLLDMIFRYNAAAIYRKSGRSIPTFGYFPRAVIHKWSVSTHPWRLER